MVTQCACMRIYENHQVTDLSTLILKMWNLSTQVKNPQFLPNPYETWRKYSPHEVIIFPKFHKNWEKIVDFLPEHLDFTFSRLGWTGLYLRCLQQIIYSKIKKAFWGFKTRGFHIYLWWKTSNQGNSTLSILQAKTPHYLGIFHLKLYIKIWNRLQDLRK